MSEKSIDADEISLLDDVHPSFWGWEDQKQQQEEQEDPGQQLEKGSGHPEEGEDEDLKALNQHMLTVDSNSAQGPDEERESLGKSVDWCRMRVKEGFFPPLKDPYKTIRTSSGLKKLLESEKVKFGREDYNYLYRQLKPAPNRAKDYVTAICGSCKTERAELGKKKIVLSKMKDDSYFSVIYFDNQHNHDYYNGRRMSNKNAKIRTILERELQRSPRDMPLITFITRMGTQFGIEDKIVRYLLKSFRMGAQNFRQLKHMVEVYQATFWFKNSFSDPEYRTSSSFQEMGDQPELFLYVYNNMLHRFQQAGNVCYLMLLDFSLRDEGGAGREWNVVALSGLTLGYIMEPFAFIFIESRGRTVRRMAEILQHLFNYFGKTPNVLITPLDEFYSEVVLAMQLRSTFEGVHLFDPILEIDRIGATMESHQDLSFFKALILSRTRSEYHHHLNRLMVHCQPSQFTRLSLSRIRKHAAKLVFGCMETMEYVGTPFDCSPNKMIREILKENLVVTNEKWKNAKIAANLKVRSSKEGRAELQQQETMKGETWSPRTKMGVSRLGYLQGVKKIMRIMRRSMVKVENSSYYDLKPYECVVDIPEIVTIRRCIKANILTLFGEQYGKAYHLDYFERPAQGAGEMRVFDVYDKPARCMYVLAPLPSYREDGSLDSILMRCNCLFSAKSGLPCSHEILGAMLTKSSLFQLFRKDYVISQKHKNSGRPRLSRRNTEK